MIKNDWKTIQSRLAALRHYSDTIDGIPGPNAKKTVRAFQKDAQLGVGAGLLSPDGVAVLEFEAQSDSGLAVGPAFSDEKPPHRVTVLHWARGYLMPMRWQFKESVTVGGVMLARHFFGSHYSAFVPVLFAVAVNCSNRLSRTRG